jgi:uncharacterized protein (TIGR03435 family)
MACGTGSPDRPVLDQTGLSGNFDVFLEFTPEINGQLRYPATFHPDPTGATFIEALREQVGRKLASQTGSVVVLVVDHVEEPSTN